MKYCLEAGSGVRSGAGKAAETAIPLVLSSSPLSTLVPGLQSCFLVTAFPIPIRRLSRASDRGRRPAPGS